MKRNPKLEIVDALLGKVNAAIDTMGGLIYTDSKKVFLDFVPYLTQDEHVATLRELKKAGAIENFESRDDCFFILHPSKSVLQEIKQSLLLQSEQKPAIGPKRLFFDTNSGKIIWGDKKCELPFKSIEYYVAEKMFESPEAKVKEDDIISHVDILASRADSPSRVVDARRRINRKAHIDFGIQELIGYKNAVYWLNLPE